MFICANDLVKVCLSGLQFTVECEWQRQESQTLSVPVPHVLSFGELSYGWHWFTNFYKGIQSFYSLVTVGFPGLTASDVTINSSGLLHTIELQHFHQVNFIFFCTFLPASVPLFSVCYILKTYVLRSTRLSEWMLQAIAKYIKVSLAFDTQSNVMMLIYSNNHWLSVCR